LLSGQFPDLSDLELLHSLGIGSNEYSGDYPGWLMDGSLPLMIDVSFGWPTNWNSGSPKGFTGTVPLWTGPNNQLRQWRITGNRALTGHLPIGANGWENNMHFRCDHCDFKTIRYDLSNMGRGWSSRYFSARANPDLQVEAPYTGLPIFSGSDSKEWRNTGLDLRGSGFNGPISQESIDSIVEMVDHCELRHIYLQQNKFTQSDLQPLIDALSGKNITFQYHAQRV
ncbi:MAG: hypothetical protein LAT56_15435, partial [Wenzhouxiangella sp.]|nr:hypothetical protein [Wenzhouxiangella sp.]